MRTLRLFGALALLAVTATARAQTCACPQGDFIDYETDTRAVQPSVLSLCTADGCGSLNVEVAHRIVTPVSTNGMPAATSPHYFAVEANGNAGFPEPAGPVTLKTDIGALFTVTLLQPRFLFAPANKSLVSPPGPPAAGPGFLCSKVKPNPRLHLTLAEQDEFGSGSCVTDQIIFACRRVDVTTPTATDWLVCLSFNKRASMLVDPTATAFVDSEFFGSFVFNSGALHTPDEFCFSATQQ